MFLKDALNLVYQAMDKVREEEKRTKKTFSQWDDLQKISHRLELAIESDQELDTCQKVRRVFKTPAE